MVTRMPRSSRIMTAIKTLNAQGRHKAQFIVNAILHYTMADNTPGKAVNLDTEEIRSICREIISEMMFDSEHALPKLVKEEEMTLDPSKQEFDYSVIADTLNGFRKK